MEKTKTAVIIGIITVVMLGVVIYLNRDKFGNSETTVIKTGDSEKE